MKNLRFSTSKSSDFSVTIKKRVNEYFKNNNKSKYGNASLILKSIFMLTLFFGPLVMIIFAHITSPWQLFLLYIISGIGMAGIGMGIMHDAIHGSFSKNKTTNWLAGKTLNLVGAYDTVWRLQHNVLHHTYTNIDGADEDIKTPFFLRFSPHVKKNALHKFQHFYTWFFYGLTTISWITTKDFMSLKKYFKMGLIKDRKEYRTEFFKIILWKIVYFSYALILPILMTSFPVWMVIVAFLTMHFITGLSISLVFQTAHVMPETQFPLPNENNCIENDRIIHQMATTSNFSPRSRVFSWFIGGLNHQVEHHLFPNICHIHYRKISKIIKQTAEEYNIPYLYKKTFVGAIWSHLKMLRYLGKVELGVST